MLILNQLLHEEEKQLGFTLTDDPVVGLIYLKKDGALLSVYQAKTITIREIRNDITLWEHLVFGKN